MKARASHTTAVERVTRNEDQASRRYRRELGRGNATVSLHSGLVMACGGRWTASCLGGIEKRINAMRFANNQVQVDMSRVDALDMTGALLLHRTMDRIRARGRDVELIGADEAQAQVMELVGGSRVGKRQAPPASGNLLEDVGRATFEQLRTYMEVLSFIGYATFLALRILLTPATMYWRVVVREMEEAGFDALPIVGLLSLLIGVVIAYQGGILLQQYGGSIFIADLVGLAVLRELAPLITAIIVAGRTGSAYTAQIGTMQVTEEVDALRSMGISPIELLVLPKMFALTLALPLLTVFADIMGVIGGMFMASALLDVSMVSFMERLNQVADIQSLLVGIGKAPVFAIIISTVGAFQGFRVSGGAGAVGRQTTVCVVQAIFLVIVVDAIFSIIFSKLGI